MFSGKERIYGMKSSISKSILGAMVMGVIFGASIARGAYVETKQGRIEGTDIRAKSNGEVILVTPRGTRTFFKGQYIRAVADKPEAYDRALKMAATGKMDEAIPILKDIVSQYRYLEWDNQARKVLAKIYMEKGDGEAAVSIIEEIKANSPTASEDSELQWAYREALLKAGKTTELEAQLDEAIQKGDRADAARAQVMRGDLKKAQGKLEPAALDYLRTVVLFKDVPEQQPAATYKAAEVLEEMRDGRSKELYQAVIKDYPDSTYAQQAKTKL